MADNVPVTPGSGLNVAADEVNDPDLGTVLEQVVKIADGRTNGTNRWKVNSDGSNDVTVVSSVLPTGAATETTLAEIGADIDAIETNTASSATAVNQATEITHLAAIDSATALSATAANQTTANTHLASIDTNAGTIATDVAHLTDASQKSQIVDSSGNVIGATSNALDTHIKSNATDFATETTLAEMALDIDSIESSVANIPPQGQALAAASMPVVLTALQVTALTPPAVITNFAEETGGHLDNIDTTLTEISADIDTIETNSNTIAGAITASKMATHSADGDHLTVGTKADAAVVDPTLSGSLVALLKGILSPLVDVWNSTSHYLYVYVSNIVSVTQSGVWSTRTQDGSGTAITSTAAALDINIKSGNPTSITANAGTNLNTSALALEAGHLATVDNSTAATSTTLGGTADAIVAAGATGSLSAKLRRATQGLADLLTGIVLAAGTNIIGKVGIDQTTPGTTNAVQPVNKEVYGTATAFAITLNGLVTGTGRQSTLLTSNTNKRALIHVSVKTGTSPTANTTIDVYLIRSDGTYADDSAGASDAGITIINAVLLGSIINNSASSNLTYAKSFDTQVVGSLGSSWGIAIVNNTGVNLNAANNNATYELIS